MGDEPVGTFAGRLRDMMAERSLRQSDLAVRVGTSREEVRRWMAGLVEPSYYMLRRLHAVLGCTWDELMGTDTAGEVDV